MSVEETTSLENVIVINAKRFHSTIRIQIREKERKKELSSDLCNYNTCIYERTFSQRTRRRKKNIVEALTQQACSSHLESYCIALNFSLVI